MVVADGPKQLVNPVFGVAHAGLESLGDLVEQQAPPRLPGGHGLDPAAANERAQALVASDRVHDRCRVKFGHNHIVRLRNPSPAVTAPVDGPPFGKLTIHNARLYRFDENEKIAAEQVILFRSE